MYRAGQGKTAVALFVDGLDLKYVQLSARGNRITLRDFKTVTLVTKFEEKQAAAAGGGADDGGFGEVPASDVMVAPAQAAVEYVEGTEGNGTVLLSLLSELPSTKYSLSYALNEPAVTYQEFENDFGLRGSKLKKKLIHEIGAMRSVSIPFDSLDMVPMANGGVLSIIREDGLHIFDLLSQIRPFLGGRAPILKVIDSADTALIGLTRASYEILEEEFTVLVYVGHDFSRLIFMQGPNFLHFAPVISEGYGSANIENTLYSRILLEQDNIALARIDRIILTGESHKVNLLEAIAPQFSRATVEYLKAPELDLSSFEGQVGEQVSEYAIPISIAWQALDPKADGFYHTNLIPGFIVEGQKAFKLAWHGWLVALGIIASIVFFYTTILKQGEEIRRSRKELAQKQSRLTDLDVFRQREATLTSEIQKYELATAVYDSASPGSDRWSRILHYIANSVEDLNSLWIYNIRKDEANPNILIISGRSIYRTRIPRLASIFERATLRAVRVRDIRKKIVYEFDIAVEQVDKSDAGVVGAGGK